MCIKITRLFHSKPKRKHSRNMKNEQEQCLFPQVSHFISESFIYVTSLSGLIKGTANYTYQPFFFFRVREKHKVSLWLYVGVPVLETCAPTARLFPLLSVSGRTRCSKNNTSHPEPTVKGRKTTQQDAFHPTGLLSLLEPLKRVGDQSIVFSSLSILNSKSSNAQLKAQLCSSNYPN